MFDFEHLST